MARSTALDQIMRELTPEKSEEMRLRRLANIKAMTMEYQLGWYVGEEIVRKYLPTLSVDMIQTRTVIEVDPAEKVECERLNDIWFEKSQRLGQEGSSKEWKELRAYHEMLEAKYLPKEVICHIQPVNYIDEDQFKLGIVRALWDSDLCHYKCSDPSDVDVKLEDDAYFTKITLKR
jgi:hypothetical protein